MRSVRAFGFSALGIATLLAAFGLSPAFAETWYVGAGAGCDSTSIQAAVDAAAQSQTTEQKIIDISSDQDYSAQSINVDNQDLYFFGGRLSCNSLFTSDATIISGEGASGPVFNITGTSNITFYNFELRDGNALTGGGINFSGNGSLVLSSTLIDFNTATYGGGLAAVSDGSL
ncbi:MAG TPA: hypothetical protein VGO25_07545, partial [Rhodanobacteraceae bacterium]|nr:hypothetical protein [Rhodanobacteraceae bacterium]